jgi:dihydropteroate synthase
MCKAVRSGEITPPHGLGFLEKKARRSHSTSQPIAANIAAALEPKQFFLVKERENFITQQAGKTCEEDALGRFTVHLDQHGMNTLMIWQCRDRRLEIGGRTLVMGILNVTPDSFSDGGRFFDSRRALGHGLQMARDGADLIDVGGESSRPGAEPVPIEEELRRVIPAIQALSRETDCLLSVDTRKARVADEAFIAGAHVVNDITAMTFDSDMAAVAREYGAGVILMHMRGDPMTMQREPTYENVVQEVADYLDRRIQALEAGGLSRHHLAVDPGIGFGKTWEHNVSLITRLDQLARLRRPVVVGLSRKSVIGKLTGREIQDRLAGSLAAAAYIIRRGAHVIRVHDVKESCDAARLVDILRQEETREVHV